MSLLLLFDNFRGKGIVGHPPTEPFIAKAPCMECRTWRLKGASCCALYLLLLASSCLLDCWGHLITSQSPMSHGATQQFWAPGWLLDTEPDHHRNRVLGIANPCSEPLPLCMFIPIPPPKYVYIDLSSFIFKSLFNSSTRYMISVIGWFLILFRSIQFQNNEHKRATLAQHGECKELHTVAIAQNASKYCGNPGPAFRCLPFHFSNAYSKLNLTHKADKALKPFPEPATKASKTWQAQRRQGNPSNPSANISNHHFHPFCLKVPKSRFKQTKQTACGKLCPCLADQHAWALAALSRFESVRRKWEMCYAKIIEKMSIINNIAINTVHFHIYDIHAAFRF